MSADKPLLVCVFGPTASGKTDVAVALRERFPVELISVDSALVYRGMDIGTAKPDAETLAKAPHRLVDVCDPAEAYSAARFCEDALREIQDIVGHGRIPLLVGGTMLYFKALLEGLSPLPPADPEVRARVERDAQQVGWPEMHERLRKIDPTAAARIHPNDPQRLSRALEVYELTGKSLSELQQKQDVSALTPYRVCRIALIPADRVGLHDRIEQRFHKMLDLGVVEEVRRLRARGDLSLELPSMRCVGYRQIWQYLDGEFGYQEMIDKGVAATRQLAKRQLTWLRSTPVELACDPLDKGLDSVVREITDELQSLVP